MEVWLRLTCKQVICKRFVCVFCILLPYHFSLFSFLLQFFTSWCLFFIFRKTVSLEHYNMLLCRVCHACVSINNCSELKQVPFLMKLFHRCASGCDCVIEHPSSCRLHATVRAHQGRRHLVWPRWLSPGNGHDFAAGGMRTATSTYAWANFPVLLIAETSLNISPQPLNFSSVIKVTHITYWRKWEDEMANKSWQAPPCLERFRVLL